MRPDDAGAVGTELNALVQNHKCPDVFFSTNMRTCFGYMSQVGRDTIPMFRVPWWFRTTFPSSLGRSQHAQLIVNGVVGTADVWLNGRYLGYHEGGSTPFALDPADALRRGASNTLLVRVSRPQLGSRIDIVPWGLTDWWEYGGITGHVWLEAQPELAVVRADVVPHLDGADIRAVVRNRDTRV